MERCDNKATKVYIKWAKVAAVEKQYRDAAYGSIVPIEEGSSLRCGDRLSNEYYCDECCTKRFW